MNIFDPVSVPLWVLVLLAGLALLYLADKLMIPSVRWMFRRKVNRVISEVNEHLQIGIRPFQLTKRRVLIDRLVFDPMVIEAMEAHVAEHRMPREVAQEEIRRYAGEIVPAFNAYIYYRLIYRLCRYVCRQLYRIRVGVADESEIRNLDREATVVFVMNHRSNFDYMLVAYLASRQTTLSYAAGEWAKVFMLQSLIRAMGAFFVRRGSGNALYRRVLERYVHMASREGVCQAVFPEGGLTRSGALAPPKLGFLDYMLRGYDVERDRDIVFIPVGINYDKVLEDRIQIAVGQGQRDPRNVLQWMATVARFIATHFSVPLAQRRDRFGYASVNFGHVISARQFAQRAGINFAQLDKQTRFEHTARLAELLMNGVGFVTPILPVPLLARLVRDKPGHGWSEDELIAAAHASFDQLAGAGAPLRAAEKPSAKTIRKALDLMHYHGLLARAGTDGPWRAADDSAECVNYYAASIDHWFDGVPHITPHDHRLDELAA